MTTKANTKNEKLVALQIINQQEPLRFLVSSDTRSDVVHLVDLESYWHSGQCGCEEFIFRIEPLLRRKIIDPCTPRAYCKHIRCARDVVAEAAINAVAKHGERGRRRDAA